MKLSNPTGRSTEEWVATHPDQAIPDRVKLRIWSRCDGKCYLSGVRITPGMPRQYDHIVAPVSYTPLTLPTNREVSVLWGDGTLKQKKKRKKSRERRNKGE